MNAKDYEILAELSKVILGVNPLYDFIAAETVAYGVSIHATDELKLADMYPEMYHRRELTSSTIHKGWMKGEENE